MSAKKRNKRKKIAQSGRGTLCGVCDHKVDISGHEMGELTLGEKVRKRKKRLIGSIQNGIIKFTKDEYLGCRIPLGIASESRFKEGNIKEMWCYTIEFKNDKFKIEFVAQIRANMAIVKPVGKKKKEILSYVDQTLQHSDIFHGPHDIKCECSASKLRSILKYVDEIRDQYEGRKNVS